MMKLRNQRIPSSAKLLLVALWVTIVVCDHAAADEKITYRLKWLINMSTVGDVVAERQGFFKEQGLDVTLKPGGPERDAIRELELGYADFGVASADQVIQARAKGSPVVVIAQLFQLNPLQWIYFKDKTHINGLQDLEGKTIGVTFGKNDELIMRTLLAKAGLTDGQVRLYSVRLDYTPFFKRHVELWPIYKNTQAIEIEQKLRDAGEAVGFFNPRDYGVRFVANSVVTDERIWAEKPDLVRRFRGALLKGWQTAIDPANAALAVTAIRQYDRDSTNETLISQLKETRLLVQPAAGETIGRIDVPSWEQTEQIMLANRQIDRPVNIARYLFVK